VLAVGYISHLLLAVNCWLLLLFVAVVVVSCCFVALLLLAVAVG
jgi:hypothetical protein